MANPVRFVSVQIGAKTYSLRFNVNAVAELEAQVGTSFRRYLFVQQMDMAAARMLLWAGLLHAHPLITPADAGELLQEHVESGGEIQDVVEKCFEGMMAAGLMKRPDPPKPAPVADAPAAGIDEPTPATQTPSGA